MPCSSWEAVRALAIRSPLAASTARLAISAEAVRASMARRASCSRAMRSLVTAWENMPRECMAA
jgi:hypothetical protein